MKSTTKRILAVAAVLGLGTVAAFAATGKTCGAWSGRHEMRMAMRNTWQLEAAPGQRDPQRLADALKLKPEQQASWQAYVATLASPGGDHGAAAAPGSAASTAPERLEGALADAQQREQRAHARLEAMKALYAQLSPEQRKVFDDAKATPFRSRHVHDGSDRS
ncbi:MAG TPA: Spy/CpxP family protein refolding chaperone [Burkholderiaceae bacterium]|nr:Spy/CpxP family protein refolding chaperone [Burkholderiaceae bacterium]